MWCVDRGFQESILVAATPAISLMFLGGFPGVPGKNEPKGKHTAGERPSAPQVAAGLEDSSAHQGVQNCRQASVWASRAAFPTHPPLSCQDKPGHVFDTYSSFHNSFHHYKWVATLSLCLCLSLDGRKCLVPKGAQCAGWKLLPCSDPTPEKR